EGRRLYELARAGVDVERAPRRIRIHTLELIRLDGADLTLAVRGSKGPYVGALMQDIAPRLGTHGHVTALRRLGVGPYAGEPMATIVELEALAEQGATVLDARLLP